MFSGQPNDAGRVISTDIEIQVLQPQGAWLPVPEADPYFGDVPGALVRNYNMLIYFNMQGDFRYEVQGEQIFFVVARHRPGRRRHDAAATACAGRWTGSAVARTRRPIVVPGAA